MVTQDTYLLASDCPDQARGSKRLSEEPSSHEPLGETYNKRESSSVLFPSLFHLNNGDHVEEANTVPEGPRIEFGILSIKSAHRKYLWL